MSRSFIIFVITVIIFQSCVYAQPGLSFDLKKPQKFENKMLGSEKSANKKFTLPRRALQNTVTHYNYYYNANRKLDEIVERSKAAHKDDYSTLLPFYNYNLKTTAQFKTDLDSVIYKSTAGILLHDLRNDWVDNLYLLIGRAYYLRDELDSAFFTFQYINYAFSPKEDDGYDKVIGSNQNEGGNALSISTNENRGIIRKALTRAPSRNESFIWQIKTYLQKDELAEAAGLIETLKNDPLFPDRLQSELAEVQAFWFYKQQMYDSSAFYLEKGLVNASGRQEESRWQYLIAQLYERAGKRELARQYYDKTIRHTLDPILEVYARLHSIKQNETDNEKGVQLTIDQLLKMARRDRYLFYRDIIYYTAAEIELDRNNYEGARALLLKSAMNSTNNADQKTKSYLLLADVSYDQKRYHDASRFYDSVDVQLLPPRKADTLQNRKTALREVVLQDNIIIRQDSMQRIANLPANEREVFIRRMVRQLRRQQGLTEDDSNLNAGVLKNNSLNSTQPIDLFRNDNNNKGDWYFSNPAMKGRGFSEFKSRWGNRPNVDNWRRLQAISQVTNIDNSINNSGGGALPGNAPLSPSEITYEALLNKLPISDEQKQVSKDSTEFALFALGKAYHEGLEDYTSAIATYEKLINNFPSGVHTEEAFFNLYYCYGKAGDLANQARMKQTMLSYFPKSKFSAMISNPDPAKTPDAVQNRNATKVYEGIYNLFVEGNFKEAIRQKKGADSVYGKNFWTPQLLYIEAIHYIQERNDTAAIKALAGIGQLYPRTPMAVKSDNLIKVLLRRKEIEHYLTNLKIERPGSDSAVIITTPPTRITTPPSRPVAQPQARTTTPGTNTPSKPGATGPVTTQPKTIPDTSRMPGKPVIAAAVFANNPLEPHYVVLVLDKVDPVYVNEARNAFNRYNKEKYYNKPIEMTNQALTDDLKLVLFKNYENAAAAIDYIERAKKVAAAEIIPWLTPQKYQFAIITESNLQVLLNTKDMNAYKRFLSLSFPNYFK